jgi:regulator of protease activity HflC (stomatin/prohibitin superfamily)
MVMFIFAILFLVLALVLFAAGRVKDGRDEYNLRPWGILPGLLAVLLFVFSLVHSVGAREVGIPVTLGHVGADLQPGVHFLAPWTTIHSCSLAQQQSIQTQAATEGDAKGNDGIPFNGSDQGSGIADTTVLYHFDPTHADTIYRKYGCDADLVKQNLIRQALKGAVPQATAQFASLDVKNNRPQIQHAIESILNADFAGDGIIVDNVVLSGLQLSAATQQAADAKLAAQQAAQTAQFHLQQANVDLQTAQVQASARQKANQTESASLSPAILCDHWINAIAQSKITVLSTNGPCGAVPAGTAPSVVVQP